MRSVGNTHHRNPDGCHRIRRFGTASTARATTKEEVAVNGTFRATSIGDYAQDQ